MSAKFLEINTIDGPAVFINLEELHYFTCTVEFKHDGPQYLIVFHFLRNETPVRINELMFKQFLDLLNLKTEILQLKFNEKPYSPLKENKEWQKVLNSD